MTALLTFLGIVLFALGIIASVALHEMGTCSRPRRSG